MISLTRAQEQALVSLSVFGFLVPNGLFLYFALTAPQLMRDAMGNPIAMVFMAEAVILLALFAWLIRRQNLRSPGWVAFIVMSIVGSLAFSVPAFLYLQSRKPKLRR